MVEGAMEKKEKGDNCWLRKEKKTKRKVDF
jgi:hypothetical protein